MNDLKLMPSSDITDLIESEAIENARSKDAFAMYEYNGVRVPRVTKILDDLFSKEFLVNYALSFRNRYEYLNAKSQSLSVGTHTHLMIEEFLKTGKYQEADFKKAPARAPICQLAFDNFYNWYQHLINNGNTFELIGLEVPVVNPFYGGCVDCIAKINNATYILDFKTSKKISYEYMLQVCAYMWTINAGYTDLPHIDGIGIIRVDKESDRYEDLFLNTFKPIQNAIINEYIRGFGTLLNAYYEKINMEYTFNQYKKSYPGLLNVIK